MCVCTFYRFDSLSLLSMIVQTKSVYHCVELWEPICTTSSNSPATHVLETRVFNSYSLRAYRCKYASAAPLKSWCGKALKLFNGRFEISIMQAMECFFMDIIKRFSKHTGHGSFDAWHFFSRCGVNGGERNADDSICAPMSHLFILYICFRLSEYKSNLNNL